MKFIIKEIYTSFPEHFTQKLFFLVIFFTCVGTGWTLNFICLTGSLYGQGNHTPLMYVK